VILFVLLGLVVTGLLMFALAVNGKVQEIGRLLFFTGLLVFLLRWSGEALPQLR
jgi:Na+/phosphate symporter